MDVNRFIPIVQANLPLLDKEYTVQEVARILMLSYGDVKTKPSGLVSKSLVKVHEPTGRHYRKGKCTGEHFKTRTKTCREICELYLKGKLNLKKLYNILDEGRAVHLVTEEENIRLRNFQQDHNYETWEEEYAACGIELVPDPGKFGKTKYYYEIEGFVYPTIMDAATDKDVHPRTVKARCNDDRYPDWNELVYFV
jgi:hypothetical protein